MDAGKPHIPPSRCSAISTKLQTETCIKIMQRDALMERHAPLARQERRHAASTPLSTPHFPQSEPLFIFFGAGAVQPAPI